MPTASKYLTYSYQPSQRLAPTQYDTASSTDHSPRSDTTFQCDTISYGSNDTSPSGTPPLLKPSDFFHDPSSFLDRPLSVAFEDYQPKNSISTDAPPPDDGSGELGNELVVGGTHCYSTHVQSAPTHETSSNGPSFLTKRSDTFDRLYPKMFSGCINTSKASVPGEGTSTQNTACWGLNAAHPAAPHVAIKKGKKRKASNLDIVESHVIVDGPKKAKKAKQEKAAAAVTRRPRVKRAQQGLVPIRPKRATGNQSGHDPIDQPGALYMWHLQDASHETVATPGISAPAYSSANAVLEPAGNQYPATGVSPATNGQPASVLPSTSASSSKPSGSDSNDIRAGNTGVSSTGTTNSAPWNPYRHLTTIVPSFAQYQNIGSGAPWGYPALPYYYQTPAPESSFHQAHAGAASGPSSGLPTSQLQQLLAFNPLSLASAEDERVSDVDWLRNLTPVEQAYLRKLVVDTNRQNLAKAQRQATQCKEATASAQQAPSVAPKSALSPGYQAQSSYQGQGVSQAQNAAQASVPSVTSAVQQTNNKPAPHLETHPFQPMQAHIPTWHAATSTGSYSQTTPAAAGSFSAYNWHAAQQQHWAPETQSFLDHQGQSSDFASAAGPSQGLQYPAGNHAISTRSPQALSDTSSLGDFLSMCGSIQPSSPAPLAPHTLPQVPKRSLPDSYSTSSTASPLLYALQPATLSPPAACPSSAFRSHQPPAHTEVAPKPNQTLHMHPTLGHSYESYQAYTTSQTHQSYDAGIHLHSSGTPVGTRPQSSASHAGTSATPLPVQHSADNTWNMPQTSTSPAFISSAYF